ncbi:Concanavalin A-like lectin protein kinase family protein [Euphorbia peplus]|nr:Concanavalin A-like lectin protein kinase family protein [Euphorbia peplus]
MLITFVLIFLFGFPGFTHPLTFNYPDFPPETTDILFEGDATTTNGAIRLIPMSSYAEYRVGKASYAKPFHLYDSSTGRTSNFATFFSFSINDLDLKPSDGFTFFLSPVTYPIPPNSAGAYLGLFNYTVDRNRIVLVEFDTVANSFDPPFSHIGINNGSISSSAYVKWDLTSTNYKEGHVWISYNATTRNLSVSCNYDSDRVYKGYSNVSYVIDLKEVLPEWVRIGFSASSGAIFEKNFAIHTWQFDSDLDSMAKTGSRNVIHMNKKTEMLIGAVGLSILMLAGGMGYFVIMKRNRKLSRNSHGNYALVSRDLERGNLPKRFTFEELETATNNFADHMKLGKGASGHVYKGTLSDVCRIIAVKKICTESANSEKTFINEVKVISRLMHRNLVQFIGWCHERGQLLLVYDYMPNGSLDTHLFGKKRALPWQTRYRIALGLASALHYLHEEAEQSVLHRDIKPANVLLDVDFGVKLGDFGVSKLVDPQFRTQTTGVVGTWGYIAPEYAYQGKATKESDMYSFGIVALEIACGRRTIKDEELHIPLVKWVWELYLGGNVIDAADEQLSTNFNREEMECLLKVGLWCSHPKAEERLKPGQVIKVLCFEASLPELPIDTLDLTCPASPSNHSQIDFMEVPSITTSIDAGR